MIPATIPPSPGGFRPVGETIPLPDPHGGATVAEVLTPQQLAQRWLVSPKTLERWRINGTGPRYLKLGSAVRYRLDDVQAFEARIGYYSTDERSQ